MKHVHSLTYEGAYREAAKGGGLSSPLALVSYRLDVKPILDTFDPKAAKLYDLSTDELGGRNWERSLEKGMEVESHALVEQLIKDGFAGIIVPSFINNSPVGAKNIVL